MPSRCFQRLIHLHNLSLWFLLTWGFNNHLMRIAPKFICPLRPFCWDPHPQTREDKDQESPPRCFYLDVLNFKLLPKDHFFLYSLTSKNVISIYHIAHRRKMKAILLPHYPILQPPDTCAVKFLMYGGSKPTCALSVNYAPDLAQRKKTKYFYILDWSLVEVIVFWICKIK